MPASNVSVCLRWQSWWRLNPPNRRGTDPYCPVVWEGAASRDVPLSRFTAASTALRLLGRKGRGIGQHPMHDHTASLRASATLAFFIPARLASFIA